MVKDRGDEVLYNTLDSAYPTDNDSEVCSILLITFLLLQSEICRSKDHISYCSFPLLQEEDFDTYTEAYGQDSDAEDEQNIMASDDYPEGDFPHGIQIEESEVEYETAESRSV